MSFERYFRAHGWKERWSPSSGAHSGNQPSFSPINLLETLLLEGDSIRANVLDPEYDLPTTAKLGMVFQSLIFGNLNGLKNTIVANKQLVLKRDRWTAEKLLKKTLKKFKAGSRTRLPVRKTNFQEAKQRLSRGPSADPDAISFENQLPPWTLEWLEVWRSCRTR